MDTGKIIVGILAGVAVGAAIGILFSPDKGVNTRQKISKKGEDLMHDLEEGFGDLYDSISKKYGAAAKEVGKAVEKGKNKMAKVTEKLDD